MLGMTRRSAESVVRGRAMERDTLGVLADVVLEHIHDAGVAAGETGFLVALPTYLDEMTFRFNVHSPLKN